MTGIQVQYWNMMENRRSNMAKEYISLLQLGETARHNLADEEIAKGNLGVAVMNAETNRLNYAETKRSHIANEEIAWFNASETQRSHQVNEAISWFNAQETQRTHMANEAIGWYNAFETERSHKANEEISWYNAKENERTHRANEVLYGQELFIKQGELTEKQRHSEVEEGLHNEEFQLAFDKWYQVEKTAEEEKIKLTKAQVDETTARAEYYDAQAIDIYAKLDSGYWQAMTGKNKTGMYKDIGDFLGKGFGGAGAAVGALFGAG